MWRIIDNVLGSDPAAPTPIITRPMINSEGEAAKAHTSDPAQKMTTPINITFLRPKLSPSDPQMSIKLAKAKA
jgi:hypothetical protein